MPRINPPMIAVPQDAQPVSGAGTPLAPLPAAAPSLLNREESIQSFYIKTPAVKPPTPLGKRWADMEDSPFSQQSPATGQSASSKSSKAVAHIKMALLDSALSTQPAADSKPAVVPAAEDPLAGTAARYHTMLPPEMPPPTSTFDATNALEDPYAVDAGGYLAQQYYEQQQQWDPSAYYGQQSVVYGQHQQQPIHHTLQHQPPQLLMPEEQLASLRSAEEERHEVVRFMPPPPPPPVGLPTLSEFEPTRGACMFELIGRRWYSRVERIQELFVESAAEFCPVPPEPFVPLPAYAHDLRAYAAAVDQYMELFSAWTHAAHAWWMHHFEHQQKRGPGAPPAPTAAAPPQQTTSSTSNSAHSTPPNRAQPHPAAAHQQPAHHQPVGHSMIPPPRHGRHQRQNSRGSATQQSAW